MKEQFNIVLLAAAIVLSTTSSFAQQETTRTPSWVSEKGYWVVESNAQTPLQNTVRFYTNQNELVYTENINGIKLNPNRRNVKMKLKQVLESAVTAWQKSNLPEANRNYITSILK